MVGLFAALVLYLVRRKNRAALIAALWGFLAGGLGFALGDFVNMLGRAQWGPIGRLGALQGLDYWKWMEQLFGLIMGIGVALVFLRATRQKLRPPAEDQENRNLNTVALLFLLVVMMWSNLHKNVRNWAEGSHLPEQLFGVPAKWWFLLVGLLLSVAVLLAILRHRRQALPLAPAGAFGRGQLLFLVILWVAVIGAFMQAFPAMANKGTFFVHVTFWMTAGVCSLIVLALRSIPAGEADTQWAASDPSWKLRTQYCMSLMLVLVLVLALGYLTTSLSEEPLPGSNLRFENAPSSLPK